MNNTPTPNTLSKRDRMLVSGGIAIIVLWAIVNYIPSSVATLSSTEAGKIIVTWAQIVLFLMSCAALVVVFTLLGQNKNFRINKFRIGSTEITFKNDELDAKD